MHAISGRSSLLRFAVVASFIPAKRQAKRIAAHKTATWASQLWHRARAMEQSADFVNGMLATWQAVPAGGSDLIFAGATTDSIVRTASCSGNSCNERFVVGPRLDRCRSARTLRRTFLPTSSRHERSRSAAAQTAALATARMNRRETRRLVRGADGASAR